MSRGAPRAADLGITRCSEFTSVLSVPSGDGCGGSGSSVEPCICEDIDGLCDHEHAPQWLLAIRAFAAEVKAHQEHQADRICEVLAGMADREEHFFAYLLNGPEDTNSCGSPDLRAACMSPLAFVDKAKGGAKPDSRRGSRDRGERRRRVSGEKGAARLPQAPATQDLQLTARKRRPAVPQVVAPAWAAGQDSVCSFEDDCGTPGRPSPRPQVHVAPAPWLSGTIPSAVEDAYVKEEFRPVSPSVGQEPGSRRASGDANCMQGAGSLETAKVSALLTVGKPRPPAQTRGLDSILPVGSNLSSRRSSRRSSESSTSVPDSGSLANAHTRRSLAMLARKGSGASVSEEECASPKEVPGKRRVRLSEDIAPPESSESTDSSSGSSSSSEAESENIRFSQLEARHRAKSMCFGADDLDLKALRSQAEPSWAEKTVNSRGFEVACAIVLALNSAVIGLQVEYYARMETMRVQVAFQITNFAFCMLFLIELLLRIVSQQPRKFFTGPDWTWNVFDTFVVACQIVETAASFAVMGASSPFSVFSGVMRMARVLRVVRLVSVLRWCRPFRVLVTAIVGTLRSCIWAALLLILIIYVFAIVFTQSVSEHLQMVGEIEREVDYSVKDESAVATLLFYWGSLPRSIFTLYKAIIGGLEWETAVTPLSDVSWFCVMLFLLYVSFVFIAVMNVVQGLFLQSAIEQAQQDQEHTIQIRLKEKQIFVERLRTLFYHLDSSRDGQISLTEFEMHLKDEHMQAFLQTFEIENTDAWTSFRLLDADGGGSVDMDEFVEGCIKLKGVAKSIQVAQLAYHDKWIMEKLADISEVINKRLPEDPLAHHPGILMRPGLRRTFSGSAPDMGKLCRMEERWVKRPAKAKALPTGIAQPGTGTNRSRPCSPMRSRPCSPMRSRPCSPMRSRPCSPCSPLRPRPRSPAR